MVGIVLGKCFDANDNARAVLLSIILFLSIDLLAIIKRIFSIIVFVNRIYVY